MFWAQLFQVMIRTPSDPGIPYVHEIRSVAPSDTGMIDAEHDDCDDDHPDEADEENGDDNIDLYLVPLIFSHVQECTPAWPEM